MTSVRLEINQGMLDFDGQPEDVARTVINICTHLVPQQLIHMPSINCTEATDYGGVFKALTHKVNLGLDSLLVDTSASAVHYFEGSTALIPSRNVIVQANNDTLFFGVGRYLAMTLYHGGEWPRLHKSTVRYLLRVSEPDNYVKSDVHDIGMIGLNAIFDIPSQLPMLPADEAALEAVCDAADIDMTRFLSIHQNDRTYDVVSAIRNAVVKYFVNDSIAPSLNAMRRGFEIFPIENGISFTLEEIEACCGSKIENVDNFLILVNIERLRTQNEAIYEMFLTCLERLVPSELESLVIYATGALRLPTTINFEFVLADQCMQAHTCSNSVDLCERRYIEGTFVERTEYGMARQVLLQGADRMFDDIMYALAHCDGFHFI